MDAIFSFEDEAEGDSKQSKNSSKKSRGEVEKDVAKMLQEISRVTARGTHSPRDPTNASFPLIIRYYITRWCLSMCHLGPILYFRVSFEVLRKGMDHQVSK